MMAARKLENQQPDVGMQLAAAAGKSENRQLDLGESREQSLLHSFLGVLRFLAFSQRLPPRSEAYSATGTVVIGIASGKLSVFQ